MPERVRPARGKSLPRFLRFNLTTGLVSIGGNLGMMRVMVGRVHLHYLAANGIAIVVCSLVNFVVSDGWVFGE
jgi:putative flippase GtrA